MEGNQEDKKFEEIKKRAKERGTMEEQQQNETIANLPKEIRITTDNDTQPEVLSASERRKLMIFEFLDMVLEMSLTIIVFLTVYIFIASPFVVAGKSMDNTFQDQEFIIVNRILYNQFVGNPQRGDVIVFHPPTPKSEYYIKRIIGIPGDTVSFKDRNVYLNGKLLEEPYTKCSSQFESTDLRSICSSYDNDQVKNKSFTVPDGYYFAMGDNRDNSSDSRACFSGWKDRSCTDTAITHFVPKANIVGKAWFVFWPFSEKAAHMVENGQRPQILQYLWPLDNFEFVKTYLTK